MRKKTEAKPETKCKPRVEDRTHIEVDVCGFDYTSRWAIASDAVEAPVTLTRDGKDVVIGGYRGFRFDANELMDGLELLMAKRIEVVDK